MHSLSDMNLKISPETEANLKELYKDKKDILMRIAEQGSDIERKLANIALAVGGGST